jgi:hypothetical protein
VPMQQMSDSRAKHILERVYESLKDIDLDEMTTFERNLWRVIHDPTPEEPTEKTWPPRPST